MECLHCFDGTTGYAAENQNADRARLQQTRRCRKSLGRFRGTVCALRIGDGTASDATVKNQNVDDQSEAWSEINEYGFQRQNPKWGWLTSCHCRAAVKTTCHQTSSAAGAVRHLRGSCADGQPALSHRNASH